MRDRGSAGLSTLAGRRRAMASMAVVGLTLGLGACAVQDDGGQGGIRAFLLSAEDARGSGEEGLSPLLEGVVSEVPEIQTLAVRGLGRMEDPIHIAAISSTLASPAPAVRAEAVNAMGQAVFNGEGDEVAGLLLDHLAWETDDGVRGVVGRTLGRMTYAEPQNLDLVEEALVGIIGPESESPPLPSLTGAVMGLESMARRNRGRSLSDTTKERLEELAGFRLQSEQAGEELGSARVRRVAFMALSASGGVDEDALRGALADPDPDVRRLALAALPRSFMPDAFLEEIEAALADPVARVRAQAVALMAVTSEEGPRCDALQDAARDPHPQVALAALDHLDQPCPDLDRQVNTLTGFMEAEEAATETGWHRGAHALLALAEVSPEAAAPHFPRLTDHPSPFARTYGARAAALLGNEEALEQLAQDEVPNVRNAAVQGLYQLRAHAADPIVISQLAQGDPQLLLTAAGLLEGTPDPVAARGPLLEALQRLTATGKETFRDPRMGILDRLAEVGNRENAVALEPYLSDLDPVVAEKAAEILAEWTGERVNAAPVPPASTPLPTPREVDDLAASTVVLEMEGGGEIHIRLMAHLAPTNAARFARLARSGYFHGLTFHRVVSNFVLQGGSPNANEMSGDGPYTRDEIGLQSNWRGTVGISTRGRDTGDGQIFINLVDNLRLDHNYTIVGEVVDGMDVVDRVVEGQRIIRARVETG